MVNLCTSLVLYKFCCKPNSAYGQSPNCAACAAAKELI